MIEVNIYHAGVGYTRSSPSFNRHSVQLQVHELLRSKVFIRFYLQAQISALITAGENMQVCQQIYIGNTGLTRRTDRCNETVISLRVIKARLLSAEAYRSTITWFENLGRPTQRYPPTRVSKPCTCVT